jgi:ornithine carbamoyltransferase
MRNLISIADLSKDQITTLLDMADKFKAKRGSDAKKPLTGMNVAMIFEKPSTRTRVSLEVAT